MTTHEKAEAVRQVLLSDPSKAGPEYDVFRKTLVAVLDKPQSSAIVEELYATLPEAVKLKS